MEVLVRIVKHVAYMCVSFTGSFGDICGSTTNVLPKWSSCEEFLPERENGHVQSLCVYPPEPDK